jgi:hypothetical protein
MATRRARAVSSGFDARRGHANFPEIQGEAWRADEGPQGERARALRPAEEAQLRAHPRENSGGLRGRSASCPRASRRRDRTAPRGVRQSAALGLARARIPGPRALRCGAPPGSATVTFATAAQNLGRGATVHGTARRSGSRPRGGTADAVDLKSAAQSGIPVRIRARLPVEIIVVSGCAQRGVRRRRSVVEGPAKEPGVWGRSRAHRRRASDGHRGGAPRVTRLVGSRPPSAGPAPASAPASAPAALGSLTTG